MPGCPYGADPTPAAAGLQKALDTTALAASIVNFFTNHRPTAIATFASSFVDINSLCELNPDPPRTLTALDLVAATSYTAGPSGFLSPNLTEWIYEWLRYQAFTTFCVCRAPVLDPTRNCLHLTNVTPPTTLNQVVSLGSVQIEPTVYNSWLINSSGEQTIWASAEYQGENPVVAGARWTLELQGHDGSWFQIAREDNWQLPPATTTFSALGAAISPLPNPCPARFRGLGGSPSSYTHLDFCFRPRPAAAPPPPDQPDIPTLPVVGPQVCTDSTICSMLTEMMQQITRLAGQLSDVQATVGGVDQLQELSRQTITGEGEVTLAVGTRAVSMELTALSSGAYTSALGRPRGLMRVGSVRWGDGIGYSAREFVDGDKFDRLRPQGALTLSYQLLPSASAILKFLG